jgi:undecaprenyl-diphosphatase
VVQGLTEFAPVSSSGHLILVPWLLGWAGFVRDPELAKAFDVALHVGTLAGGLAYFARDVGRYARAWFRSVVRRSLEEPDERLAWLLVVATAPGLVAGAAAEGPIERHLGLPWLVAVMLGAFGVLLLVVDRRSPSSRGLHDLRLRDAVVVGLAQAVALQPGVSRSGITITAARALGVDRASAARFSFLLSLPIVAGAGLVEGLDLVRTGLPPGASGPFLWGTVASAVSGFLVIWGLLAYLRRRAFTPFVLYRVGLSVAVLVAVGVGLRPAAGL